MPRKFKPVTPSLRSLVLPSNDQLTEKSAESKKVSRKAGRPCKELIQRRYSSGGRNHHGRITCRHRGGGHKKLYRIIDFKRDKDGVEALVEAVQYDPNRTAFIALLHYADGEKRYILAPVGIKRGDKVYSGSDAPFNPGCCMQLKSMPLGSVIHNIESVPGRGGRYVRAAGLSAQLMARDNGYATVKMPSGEVRMFLETCKASFGSLSNPERSLAVVGKAGRTRWKGVRPTVRGTVMNPVDHPHGGGEGKHNGYLPRTPWGMCTKGYKTRSKRKSNKMIVRSRHKSGRRR